MVSTVVRRQLDSVFVPLLFDNARLHRTNHDKALDGPQQLNRSRRNERVASDNGILANFAVVVADCTYADCCCLFRVMVVALDAQSGELCKRFIYVNCTITNLSFLGHYDENVRLSAVHDSDPTELGLFLRLGVPGVVDKPGESDRDSEV